MEYYDVHFYEDRGIEKSSSDMLVSFIEFYSEFYKNFVL
jgi:hypothetical protein